MVKYAKVFAMKLPQSSSFLANMNSSCLLLQYFKTQQKIYNFSEKFMFDAEPFQFVWNSVFTNMRHSVKQIHASAVM
jgi:hypothetical protein